MSLEDQFVANQRDAEWFRSTAFAYDNALWERAERLVREHYGTPDADERDQFNRDDEPPMPVWYVIYAGTPGVRYVLRLGRDVEDELYALARPNPHGLPPQYVSLATQAFVSDMIGSPAGRGRNWCDWCEKPDPKPDHADRDVLIHSRGAHVLLWSVCGKCRRRLDRLYPNGLLWLQGELAELERRNLAHGDGCQDNAGNAGDGCQGD